jgi:hypothetical protein
MFLVYEGDGNKTYLVPQLNALTEHKSLTY